MVWSTVSSLRKHAVSVRNAFVLYQRLNFPSLNILLVSRQACNSPLYSRALLQRTSRAQHTCASNIVLYPYKAQPLELIGPRQERGRWLTCDLHASNKQIKFLCCSLCSRFATSVPSKEYDQTYERALIKNELLPLRSRALYQVLSKRIYQACACTSADKNKVTYMKNTVCG